MVSTFDIENARQFLSSTNTAPTLTQWPRPFMSKEGFLKSDKGTRVSALYEDDELVRRLIEGYPSAQKAKFFIEAKESHSETESTDSSEHKVSASMKIVTPMIKSSQASDIRRLIETGNDSEDEPSTRRYLVEHKTGILDVFRETCLDDIAYSKFYSYMSRYFDLPEVRPVDTKADVYSALRTALATFKGEPLLLNQMKDYGAAGRYAAGFLELCFLGRLMNVFPGLCSFKIYGYGTTVAIVRDTEFRPILEGDFATLVTNGSTALPAVYRNANFNSLEGADFNAISTFFEKLSNPKPIRQ